MTTEQKATVEHLAALKYLPLGPASIDGAGVMRIYVSRKLHTGVMRLTIAPDGTYTRDMYARSVATYVRNYRTHMHTPTETTGVTHHG